MFASTFNLFHFEGCLRFEGTPFAEDMADMGGYRLDREVSGTMQVKFPGFQECSKIPSRQLSCSFPADVCINSYGT
jgi:hypothetical protein